MLVYILLKPLVNPSAWQTNRIEEFKFGDKKEEKQIRILRSEQINEDAELAKDLEVLDKENSPE